MAHYILNFSGDRETAAAFLRAKLWGVGNDERHRDELAPEDLVLIYLAVPREFVGRAELATAVRIWTAAEVEVSPGDPPSGVSLSHVEEWNPPVPMDAVLSRIDPTGSNPYVQANATAGFQMDVVRVTEHEYDAVLEEWAERLPPTG
jgi:hypothetical protein